LKFSQSSGNSYGNVKCKTRAEDCTMRFERHIAFWIVALAVFVGLFWLLHHILLPFVVGSPKLVGESLGRHPLWLIFAQLASGYLFGFVGLLLAVPLAAAAGVLTRFAQQRCRASPLYTGKGST